MGLEAERIEVPSVFDAGASDRLAGRGQCSTQYGFASEAACGTRMDSNSDCATSAGSGSYGAVFQPDPQHHFGIHTPKSLHRHFREHALTRYFSLGQ